MQLINVRGSIYKVIDKDYEKIRRFVHVYVTICSRLVIIQYDQLPLTDLATHRPAV